jgi:hypothetical protein
VSRYIDRKSDSQANAEALARRSATYADENARSWQVQFDRPTHEPKSTSGYIHELRDAYEAECPTRLHRHDVDAGGTPAFTAAFEAWLWGSPFRIEPDTGTYNTPLRACLAGMSRARDERTQSRARIAYAVIVGGQSPSEAGMREGVPAHWAEVVASDALRVTWRRLVRGPIPLPDRNAVA